LRAIGTEYLY